MPAPWPGTQSVNINESLHFYCRMVEKFAGAREGANSESCLVMRTVSFL